MAKRRPGVPLRALRRLPPSRVPKDLALVVTEGEKTEPLYLNAFRQEKRLATATIKVVPSNRGSDPVSVVRYALELREENKKLSRKTGEPKFDRVYCLIDRDQHANFHEAVQLARSRGIWLVRSIPCFEVWFLLHFDYSSAPYPTCADLIQRLRTFLPGYTKCQDVFSKVWDKSEVAIQHSQTLYLEQKQHCDIENGEPNPFTEMHSLVEYLLKQSSV